MIYRSPLVQLCWIYHSEMNPWGSIFTWLSTCFCGLCHITFLDEGIHIVTLGVQDSELCWMLQVWPWVGFLWICFYKTGKSTSHGHWFFMHVVAVQFGNTRICSMKICEVIFSSFLIFMTFFIVSPITFYTLDIVYYQIDLIYWYICIIHYYMLW